MFLKYINNEPFGPVLFGTFVSKGDQKEPVQMVLFLNFFLEKSNTKNMKKKEMLKKVIIGISAGFISGLFSTGGGLILVPAFSYLLSLETVESRATSIMCILPMVITTSFFYAKNDYIDWKLGTLCAIGGVIGSYIGSKILNKMPKYILKIAFTIFLFYVAIKMIGII